MNKYGAYVIVGIFVIGFVFGLNEEYLLSSVIGISFSFKYLLLIIGIIVLSSLLSFLGIPLFIFYLVLDIFAAGLVTSFFFKNYFLSGIIFSIVFILLFKLFSWFLLLLNSFYSIKLIKNNYIYLFYRYRANKNNSKLYLSKIFIINMVMIGFVLVEITLGSKIIIPLANYLLF